MRISDWSSDVCSSDLAWRHDQLGIGAVTFDVDIFDRRGKIEHVESAHQLFRKGGVLEYGNDRSEEHTSELQSLMRISYAVFCLKKKTKKNTEPKKKQLTNKLHKHEHKHTNKDTNITILLSDR